MNNKLVYLIIAISCFSTKMAFAEDVYECTGPNGSVSYQLSRCDKNQHSKKMKDEWVDPRTKESANIVLECSPCGPGHPSRWVTSGAEGQTSRSNSERQMTGQSSPVINNQRPTMPAVMESQYQTPKPRLEDKCKEGIFNALCRADMRERQKDLDRIDREIAKENFEYQQKREYLEACLKAGLNRTDSSGRCVR